MSLNLQQTKAREKTLRIALLLSMWAPLATGYAVIVSQSTTQFADFIRRSVELIALFISWRVFCYLERGQKVTAEVRARLEKMAGISVAIALFCSGLIMLVLSYNRLHAFTPGGNVYPGLAIAVLGFIVNSWFWRRYAVLTREQYSVIIAAQKGLYRAKAAVDLCVVIALMSVAIYPGHLITRYVDVVGSIVVALYLLGSGLRTGQSALSG